MFGSVHEIYGQEEKRLFSQKSSFSILYMKWVFQ